MDFKILIADSALADLREIVEFVRKTIPMQQVGWAKNSSLVR